MVSEISPSSPPPWGPSIIHRNILNIIDRYGPLACPAATTQTAGEKMRKNATNRLIFQIQRSVHFLFKNYKKPCFSSLWIFWLNIVCILQYISLYFSVTQISHILYRVLFLDPTLFSVIIWKYSAYIVRVQYNAPIQEKVKNRPCMDVNVIYNLFGII